MAIDDFVLFMKSAPGHEILELAPHLIRRKDFKVNYAEIYDEWYYSEERAKIFIERGEGHLLPRPRNHKKHPIFSTDPTTSKCFISIVQSLKKLGFNDRQYSETFNPSIAFDFKKYIVIVKKWNFYEFEFICNELNLKDSIKYVTPEQWDIHLLLMCNMIVSKMGIKSLESIKGIESLVFTDWVSNAI